MRTSTIVMAGGGLAAVGSVGWAVAHPFSYQPRNALLGSLAALVLGVALYGMKR
jgi:hypothetical protein